MKKKPLLYFVFLFFVNYGYSQIGVTSITTTSYNLTAPPTITNRLGAGVTQASNGVQTRFDSTGTNFTINFNTSATADSIAVSTVTIASIGTGSLLNVNAIAKVRRVANANVPSAGEHYPFWATVSAGFPANNATTGTFNITAPEISTLENALVTNNISTGYDNVFQNTNANVHYANIERLDYVIPLGFTPSGSADLTRIGFTIYDRGTGDPFKIAGIKALNASNDPSDYNVITASPFASCLAVAGANFGANLLATNINYIIFQKDPRFNNSESRPSVSGNQNIRGVFISLASLGYTAGQTVYGFSLIPDDMATSTTVANLLNFSAYPTTTANTSILDLVNGLGVANFSQIVLSNNVKLTAKKVGKNVLLSWISNSSNLNASTILQRGLRTDNYINLTNLSVNSNSFLDTNPIDGTSFYRLKFIAADGKIDYSNAQVINTKKTGATIFPTIVSNMLFIKPDASFSNKPISIIIYSLDGKLINAVIESYNTLISFNTSHLTRGKYFIVLKQDNTKMVSQYFVKE